MANTDYKSVAQYLAARPKDQRAVLERVRRTILKALPRAEEVISYQIPAYKVDGKLVVYFAGWKDHYSIYPMTRRIEAALKDELSPFELNNKGTVRFPLETVPARLITRIVKLLAEERAAAPKAKRASGSKPKAAAREAKKKPASRRARA
jgi:uncharacterized protein YdhG (YjbR/CyaY superfamily)